MSDKGFTDDDDDIRNILEKLDETIVYSGILEPHEFDTLRWAAEKFLEAKAVIECYSTSFEGAIGAKAREYLDTLNKS